MILLYYLIKPQYVYVTLTHASEPTCTDKQTPTLGRNRDGGEDTDRGKALERQITGLDKLHFNCDHGSRLDVPLQSCGASMKK